jgi:putative ABC transport system substrate-binding protein
VRWGEGDPRLIQAYARDLVGLLIPDVLLSQSSVNLEALQRETSTIPIVFLGVADPVEQGFLPNLAHPGGNITGFANPEFSIAGKWADLIKQMAGRRQLNPRPDPVIRQHIRGAQTPIRQRRLWRSYY